MYIEREIHEYVTQEQNKKVNSSRTNISFSLILLLSKSSRCVVLLIQKVSSGVLFSLSPISTFGLLNTDNRLSRLQIETGTFSNVSHEFFIRTKKHTL